MAEANVRHVASPDGTEIGYFTTGQGPSLLLVHGGFGDHRRWDALRPHLEEHVTVHAMDRRGRGASGDHPEYAIEREYEDVAAVVDAIAEDTGEPVGVYGTSLGGMCALGAAGLTANMRRLALYEGWPPVPAETSPPPGFIERAEQMLAAGDRDGALVAGYRELLELSDDEIEGLRSRPEWAARVATAHTMPRELATVKEMETDSEMLRRVPVPTLLLVGEEGPDWQPERIAEEIPDARIEVLAGQSHTADLFAPELVAGQLLDFLKEPDRHNQARSIS